MLRAAAPRLVTAVGAGAAASANIASPASAEAAPSANSRQIPLYTNCLLKQTDGLPRTPYQEQSDPTWDTCSDAEEIVTHHTSGYSLGTVPTREEVQQATYQLRDTLRRNSNAGQNHLDSSASFVGKLQADPSTEFSGLVSYHASKMVQCSPNVERGQIVGQALDIFDRDRDVQDAVVSLAQDPAIWHAIQQNEGVRSLLRRRRGPSISVQLEESDPDCIPEPVAMTGVHFNKKTKSADPLGELLHRMVLELNNVKKTIEGFATKLFGTAPAPESEAQPASNRVSEATDDDDAIFPTVLILTILVVGIVVFNRPVIVG